MSWLTMLKNMLRAFSAVRARSSALSSSAVYFANRSSWITNTWKKQLTMRQPSDVNGVSGQATCIIMATDIATPHRTTIALLLRSKSLRRIPLATTRSVVNMP